MRLICPKCGAEYEPPRNMLPSGGRHVQCSACHTRWFARAEGPPLLTEEQIIARLESRQPSLRVVSEPLAAPWSGPSEPEAAPQPAAGESAFTWESPSEAEPSAEPAAEAKPAPAFAEARTDFVFKSPAEPEGRADKEDFLWESPSEPSGASEPAARAEVTATPAEAAPEAQPEPVPEARPEPVPEARPEPVPEARPEPASGPDVAEEAAARYPLRPSPGQKPAASDASGKPPKPSPAPAPKVQYIYVHTPAKANRFWLGLVAAIAVFAVLAALYFAARDVPTDAAAIGSAANAYAGLVDGLREGIAAILPPRG